MFDASMPPIANQASSSARVAACSIRPRPVAGRPSFVGVAQTGPTLSSSGRSSPVAAAAASTSSGEWLDRPTTAAGPASRRASPTLMSS
jgi:hypothetical protein